MFLFLVWRASRLIAHAEPAGAAWTRRDIVMKAFWPAAAWAGVVLTGAVIFSTMQAYGPRVAVPKTELTISTDDDALFSMVEHVAESQVGGLRGLERLARRYPVHERDGWT